MRPKLGRVISLLIAGCCLAAGCSGSDRPEVAPVRGQVTYQGQPVAGAMVSFLCQGAPRLATATTDESGNYALTTFEPNDGAIIGSHVVTVKKDPAGLDALPPGVSADAKITAKSTEAAVQQNMVMMEKAEKLKSPLPPKFADMRTSDLRKEVVEGDNVINLELKD
jgi:hypothetical protein